MRYEKCGAYTVQPKRFNQMRTKLARVLISVTLLTFFFTPDRTNAAVKDVATYILSSKCSGDKGAALGFSVIDGALKAKSLAQIAKIG